METIKIIFGCTLLAIGIDTGMVLLIIFGLIPILSGCSNITWRFVNFLQQIQQADQEQ